VSGVLGFPETVNEKAARVVAGGVALIGVLALATGALWLAAVLCAGFVARVLAGPRLSPLALLATKVVAPRLGAPREVPGPPKRFAQAMGAVMSATAAALTLGAGADGAAAAVLGVLVAAATLEAAFALCLGCHAFALLMRAGLIPAETCRACAELSRRPAVE
jgi:hypothetical protein